jgi:hypothetical protein
MGVAADCPHGGEHVQLPGKNSPRSSAPSLRRVAECRHQHSARVDAAIAPARPGLLQRRRHGEDAGGAAGSAGTATGPSLGAVGLAGAGVALYGTRRTGSWRPSLQRLLPFVQSLWLSTKWAVIHVRKKGQLAAVLTTPTFENGPKLGFCWACGRGGRKVVAFDATYIWPGRIGENVRPTLGAVHGRDHDRLQSLGLAAARGVHDGAWRGSGVGHRPVLRGWLRGGSRRRPWELVACPSW